MKSKPLTKTTFLLLIPLCFLTALLLSRTLLAIAYSWVQEYSLEPSGKTEEEEEETSFEENGEVAVTRKVDYQNKSFPISRMRWVEDIEGVSYSGSVKLQHFIYNQSENRTTATYSGRLYPK